MNFIHQAVQDPSLWNKVEQAPSGEHLAQLANESGFPCNQMHLQDATSHIKNALQGYSEKVSLRNRPDLLKKLNASEDVAVGGFVPYSIPDLPASTKAPQTSKTAQPTPTPEQKTEIQDYKSSAINLAQLSGLSEKKAKTQVDSEIQRAETQGMTPEQAAEYVQLKQQAVLDQMSSQASGKMTPTQVKSLRKSCTADVDKQCQAILAKNQPEGANNLNPVQAMEEVTSKSNQIVTGRHDMIKALEKDGVSAKQASLDVQTMIENMQGSGFPNNEIYQIVGIVGKTGLEKGLSQTSMNKMLDYAMTAEEKFLPAKGNPTAKDYTKAGEDTAYFMIAMSSKITKGENITWSSMNSLYTSVDDEVKQEQKATDFTYTQAMQYIAGKGVFCAEVDKTMAAESSSSYTNPQLYAQGFKWLINYGIKPGKASQLMMQAGTYIAAKIKQGVTPDTALKDWESGMNNLVGNVSFSKAATLMDQRVRFENMQHTMGMSYSQAASVFDNVTQKAMGKHENPVVAGQAIVNEAAATYGYLKNYLAAIDKYTGEQGVTTFMDAYKKSLSAGDKPTSALSKALKATEAVTQKGQPQIVKLLIEAVKKVAKQNKEASTNDSGGSDESDDDSDWDDVGGGLGGGGGGPSGGSGAAYAQIKQASRAADNSDVNFSESSEGKSVDTAEDVGEDVAEDVGEDVAEDVAEETAEVAAEAAGEIVGDVVGEVVGDVAAAAAA
nr:Nif11-like leader peptide family natural product precursor [Desulfovibrio inopinatus]